jgi:hypothetical protein
MLREPLGIRTVEEEELRSVRGGTFWSRLKSVGRWIKNHVVIGLHSIGIKGKF